MWDPQFPALNDTLEFLQEEVAEMKVASVRFSGDQAGADYIATLAGVRQSQSKAVMITAEVTHHAHVAPITNGSRTVR